MSAPLRFGFIGCGKVSGFHADVISALGHHIDCVCARQGSPNIEGFSKKYKAKQQFSSWQKMVDQRQPDALVVAVSWDQTERIISDIIQSGLPCLVEKPVALSSEKMQEIISETKPWHHQVLVAYNRRFYDFIPQLKKVIEAERPLSIDLKFPETLKRLIQSHSEAIAEHILVYMSSHWFDLLRYLAGELKVEYITRRQNTSTGATESINGILISQRDLIPIHIQGNFDTPANTSLTFNFSEKVYELRSLEQMTVYEGMTVEPETREIPIKRFKPQVKETFFVDTKYKPGFLGQMRHFIERCVKKTTTDDIGCTLPEALAVIKLCEQIKGASLSAKVYPPSQNTTAF